MESINEVFGEQFGQIPNPISTPLHRQTPSQSLFQSPSLNFSQSSMNDEEDTPSTSSTAPKLKRKRREMIDDDEILIKTLQRQVLEQELLNARHMAVVLVKAEHFFDSVALE